MQQNQNREILHFTDFKDVGMSYESSPRSFPEHWHLSAEFILAHKDNCRYMINKTEYVLNAGDILLVWPAEVHSVVETPDKASMILQFSSEILSHLKDIDLISHRFKSRHVIRKDEGDLYNLIAGGINSCYILYHSGELFTETKIKMVIINMLYNIAIDIVTTKKGSLPDNSSDSYYRVQEACEYIIENCTRDISQKEVAEYVNFSIYYFSRIFREYTKESFNDFLTRQRLEQAVRLLTQGDISITEVAFLSGFQSISNFNKTFLKAKGCSPKQYRKLWQDEDPHRSLENIY